MKKYLFLCALSSKIDSHKDLFKAFNENSKEVISIEINVDLEDKIPDHVLIDEVINKNINAFNLPQTKGAIKLLFKLANNNHKCIEYLVNTLVDLGSWEENIIKNKAQFSIDVFNL